MKKVLHIWQAAYPWEVRIGKINRSLMAAGSEVMVLARNKGDELEQEVVNGELILRVGSANRILSVPVPGSPFWGSAISTAIRDFKADLVIVRDIPLAGLAVKAGRKCGVPVVLDMAEHYPEAMRSWKKYSENFILRKIVHDWKIPDRIEASVMKGIDGVLVVCEEQRERLIAEYGYPHEKICLVLNSADIDKWRSFPKGTKREKPFCFGYHGILCEDRQLDVVLRGFDLAAEKEKDITLLFAGGGESEQKLREIRETLKHKDRIEFTGRFTPEQLPGLYERTDFGIVSLLVNKFTEHTVANKFFDYACIGKPFIHTDLAPLNRIGDQMNCGVRFKGGSPESVAQAMLEIRRVDYAKMSANGMAAIEREFNWNVDEKRMLNFMTAICLE